MNQPQPVPERPVIRVPLTPAQHILHLILTLVTFGLWGIVWLIRGLQGNKVWADTQPGYQPWVPYGRQPQPPPRAVTDYAGDQATGNGTPAEPVRPPVTDPRTGLQKPEGYQ